MPQRLGRYELLEALGEGGMGAVWLARLTGSHGFEKLCIVKTVLPSIAKDQDFVSRFLHEGRVLTQLHHANIAQVYDMGDEGGVLYLALEYVPGVDLSVLHQHVRAHGEALPVSLAVYLVQQVAEGLGYAHRKAALDGAPLHIVHRDVSPQNVMVSYEGEVKVIDFGIAKSEARSRHTAQASVMGKLGYMAPEQARGEPVDHRADQFAIAVVLWELLTNTSYVPRGTLTEMVVAMANPAVRPLSPLRADLPPTLEATVLKALASDPAQRFATTDEFARALMDELLRMGALPSKLQVGEYVRARCNEAFSSQQQLLTRASTVRGPVVVTPVQPKTEPARPAVMPAQDHEAELDSTLVRPSGEHPLPTPASPEPPLSTRQLQASVRPRRWPAVIAVLALLGVISGVVAWKSMGADVVEAAAVMDAGAVAVRPPPAEPVVADAAVAVVVAPDEALDAGPVEPLPVTPPPLAPSEPELAVRARFTGKSYVVSNNGRERWTSCTLVMPGQRVARLARLGGGSSEEVPVSAFRFNASEERVVHALLVRCDQGVGRASVR